MRSLMMRLGAAAVLALSVSACVPDPGMVEAGLAKPPAPKLVADAYAAKVDSGIQVPALNPEDIPDQFERQSVYYPTTEAPGTIIIDPSQKVLHFVTGKNQAIRYGIAVGREGFQWSGEALVTGRKPWPTWTPPPEMIARDPKLAKWEKGQPGGPSNPLGARAIYLTTNGVDYGYRIHGTPEWKSIGRNASSGCIRMINQDVMDLYERVPDGAKVIVLTADGKMPKGLSIPPQPKVKKPAATVQPASAPVVAPPLKVLPAPVFTQPAAPATAVAAPAVAPAAEPAAAPAATPAPAPAATAVCAVPLVNGVCPQG